ncbi:MAG: lipopolysaccharide biosynthesis protein [Flavobacterium sp.]
MKENKDLNDFWKNVAKLASGSLISQVFVIVLTPIIARLYSPADYGTLSLINSIVGIVVIVASLRLERALVLVGARTSTQLLNLCNTITFLFAILILLLVLFFDDFFNQFFKIEPAYLLFVIPFLVFVNGILNAFKSFGNSFKVYGLLTTSIVINSILSSSLKVVAAFFFAPTALLLVASESISVVVTLVFLFVTFRFANINFQYSFPKLAFVSDTIKAQKQFLKYDIVSSLLNNFSWLMPALLLSYYFDKSVVGFYSLGFTMLRLPMNLLGKAIGDVYYKSASDSIDPIALKENTLKIVVKLFGFGLLPIFFITLFGDQLFVLLFGMEWEQAGVYSQILSFWSLIWFVASPISNIYYIKNLQDKLFNFTLISLLLRAASLMIGGWLNDAVVALVLFSIVSFMLYLFQLVYLLQKVEVDVASIFSGLFSETKYASIVIILFFTCYFYQFPFLISLSVGSFSILGYFGYKFYELKQHKKRGR